MFQQIKTDFVILFSNYDFNFLFTNLILYNSIRVGISVLVGVVVSVAIIGGER